MFKSLPCFAALIVALGTFASVQAVPLATGTVPIPMVNPGAPIEVFPTSPTAISGGFSQTWSAPAHPNWVGTFTMTGVEPNSPSLGTTTYDFTSLPLGFLPVGSIIRIGDLDNGGGSNSEMTTVSGTTCAVCVPGIGSFIEEPFGVTDAIGNFTPTPDEMPFVTVSGISSEIFLFDGSIIPTNPGIAFAMETNQPLATLTVTRNSSANSLHILAPPVPEPASLMLMAPGMALWLRPKRSESTRLLSP